MTEQRMRVLDPNISAQERNLICEAYFGKSFMEMVDQFRYDELKEGIESGDYVILSVENINDMASTKRDDECVLEVWVCFTLTRPYDPQLLMTLGMLYDIDDPAPAPNRWGYTFTNVKFYTKLYGAEALEWAVAQIRRLQQMV